MQVSGEWEGPSERRRGSILFLRSRTNPGFTWEWVAEVGLHGQLKNMNNKNHMHKTTHQILNNPNIPKMRDRLYELIFYTESLCFVLVFKENEDEKKQTLRTFLRKEHWFFFFNAIMKKPSWLLVSPRFVLLGYTLWKCLYSSGAGKSSTGWKEYFDSKSSTKQTEY